MKKPFGGSIRINKRQFILLVIFVILLGSAGLAAFTYVIIDDGFGVDRSTSVMGRPKFIREITSTGDAKLSNPLSVSIAGRNIYVTNSAKGKLSIFTKRGAFVSDFKLLKDASTYPLGVAVDEKDNVYVSVGVRGYYHVMVVDSYGRFLGRFPAEFSNDKNRKQTILNHPTGLFYRDGRLYITDAGDHDVKVFTTDGRLIMRFGRAGTGKGEFMYPHGVIADDDRIYVVDSNNSRVQVFDKNGKFKYFFRPNAKKPFIIPRGIAIDGLNRVHIVDLAAQEVFVFTKEGNYLLSYGADEGKRKLSYPNGIAIDPESGLIYIADKHNDRVVSFSE